MKRVAALAAAIACVGHSPIAEAVEREHQLGVDVGPNMLVIGKLNPTFGLSTGAHYTYGLNDQFTLLAEATWSFVSLGETVNAKTPHTHPAWIGNADVGIGYVFDVLRWVPYAGILLGGYTLAGRTIGPVKEYIGVELTLGLDYRIDRRWTVGAVLRQHMMSDPTLYPDFDNAFSAYPSFSQALIRADYVWGW